MNENSNDIGGAAGMNSSADGREAGQFDGGTHTDEAEKKPEGAGEHHRNPNELDHHDPETEEDTASGGPA